MVLSFRFLPQPGHLPQQFRLLHPDHFHSRQNIARQGRSPSGCRVGKQHIAIFIRYGLLHCQEPVIVILIGHGVKFYLQQIVRRLRMQGLIRILRRPHHNIIGEQGFILIQDKPFQ